MYNLSVDEISMIDGGGDGNSSGYPASPSAVKQQASSPTRGCAQAIAGGMITGAFNGGLSGGAPGAIAGTAFGGFGAAISGSCNI